MQSTWSPTVAHIEAPRLGCANDPGHVRRIAEQLQLSGLLKISLQFADDDSAYLQQLLVSLHENHGHRLPIAHSATRGWFWDVRPSDADFQAGSHQARSETMDEFPWHTDCSYEDPLPRYFALQVLQHDRFGGGTLSVINVERLSRLLSSEARAALARPEYQISVPPEFIKDPTRRTTTGSLLAADATGRAGWMRFRQDIVAPVSERASGALEELKEALHGAATEPHSTVHLTADELPARSIILVDNRRWLHSRSHVRDPDRHLRRVVLFLNALWVTPLYRDPAGEVLSVARIHPFYVCNVQYPPDTNTIKAALEKSAQEPTKADLRTQSLLRKRDLYKTIERLIIDTNPRNTYRHAAYASVTGGGFGSRPLFFATDVHENRRHRGNFGRFVRDMGIIKDGDWVLTMHTAGELYRSLDLTLEILENAGASVLAAGHLMSPADIVRLLVDYNVNILCGDSSQIAQSMYHISALPQEIRDKLNVDQIIYTSETLTPAQRAHISEVLGPVKICSFMGSAEAGPYAVSNPDLTGSNVGRGYEDFVFDTRATLFEILPPSFAEQGSNPDPVTGGEQGIIAQTSLARLRNPLVRYITGDIGSLHPFPEEARSLVPETEWPHLRLLRLQGRDTRFSFDWDGEYIEFHHLATLLNNEECGVLQWQVVLGKMDNSAESSLQVRLLCSPRNRNLITELALTDRVRTFFHAYSGNEHRFQLIYLKDLDGFHRSSTGRKIIKFVDNFN
ncbi:hypothetical protein B0J13DRAFT_597344 [Dactylonectria estremocensis]|uniref:TauD/TfdA-like domain-containing protein n=1 Tax=Dactylonectria estremocensis TaxID=1079267 RepID=A0A9P9EG76_9HYPO|nr:hypothetical protein B0J13DRAFT_597344 [Dactylonectria estremocensis]